MPTSRTRLAWGAACAALVCVCAEWLQARSPAQQNPPWASQVDAVFAQWDRLGSPGCALGVYQNGRTLYTRGYGMADLEHDSPITPDSVFYAGSVSKQFTAMAAALAIRQGRLDADDDVRKYVPELPEYGRTITIRHLLHHTSGSRDVNTLMVLAGRRDEDAFDNEAVLRIVSRQKALNFVPGLRSPAREPAGPTRRRLSIANAHLADQQVRRACGHSDGLPACHGALDR